MELRNHRLLSNTREKLRRLDEQYDETRNDVSEESRICEMFTRSIKQLINQLKEEIAPV